MRPTILLLLLQQALVLFERDVDFGSSSLFFDLRMSWSFFSFSCRQTNRRSETRWRGRKTRKLRPQLGTESGICNHVYDGVILSRRARAAQGSLQKI